MASADHPITLEDCESYLADDTFREIPKDMALKYPHWAGAVGLEIEMLAIKSSGDPKARPERAALATGDHSISRIIFDLAKKRRWKIESLDGKPGKETGDPLLLKVLIDTGDALTFEPGGQVEISTLPYPCLSDSLIRLKKIQGILDEALAEGGLRLIQTGINPWHTVDEIGLQMAKPRYRAMDEYFTRISPFGRRMMRQTTTMQVNLDFGNSEEDLAKRYLASQLLSPFGTACFSYSGVVDDQLAPEVGYRSRAWREIDPGRTGLVGVEAIADTMTKRACVTTYLEFALNAPVTFVTAKGFEVPPKDFTFRKWLIEGWSGIRPVMSDFQTHLSLLFPEVRPRGFIEIRSIDCQARCWQDVVAAYYVGLLYDAKATTQVLNLLLPHRHDMPAMLLGAAKGPKGHPVVQALSRQVMTIAQEGLERMSDCFRSEDAFRALHVFAEHFTNRDKCPGEDLLDLMASRGAKQLRLPVLDEMERNWAARLAKG